MPDPSHGNMHHNSCKCGQIWDSLYTKEEVELLHILMVRGENVCSLQLKCHAVNSQSPWESVYSIAKLFKTAGQRLVWPTVSAAVTRKCMGSPPCMGRLLITTGVDTINFLVSPLSMSGCYGLHSDLQYLVTQEHINFHHEAYWKFTSMTSFAILFFMPAFQHGDSSNVDTWLDPSSLYKSSGSETAGDCRESSMINHHEWSDTLVWIATTPEVDMTLHQ